MNKKPAPKAAALIPIGVFLVLYLGLGILFEYILKIPMGFYQIPIVVAFLAAILVACRARKRDHKNTNFDIAYRAALIIILADALSAY